jgi:hypothetical protein
MRLYQVFNSCTIPCRWDCTNCFFLVPSLTHEALSWAVPLQWGCIQFLGWFTVPSGWMLTSHRDETPRAAWAHRYLSAQKPAPKISMPVPQKHSSKSGGCADIATDMQRKSACNFSAHWQNSCIISLHDYEWWWDMYFYPYSLVCCLWRDPIYRSTSFIVLIRVS